MTETSKPTGKVQRLILDELNRAIADRGRDRAVITSDSIVWRLRAIDLGLEMGVDLPSGETPSRSDYVSVCRAARELARRGLVSINKRTHQNERDRRAVLWIAPPGVIEDERRPGLAETVSKRVVEILSGALTGEPPQGSRSVGCPPGHVTYRWLHRELRRVSGDRWGQFAKQITRAIDKAEERGVIVVVRDYRHGTTGWSTRRVSLFVALSDTFSTKQQFKDSEEYVR
jgi:hypothetical protein